MQKANNRTEREFQQTGKEMLKGLSGKAFCASWRAPEMPEAHRNSARVLECFLLANTWDSIRSSMVIKETLVHHGESALVPAEMWQGPLPIDMNDAQLNELFVACLPRLKKSARKMLRNPEDCEDALQDGLLLAFRNLRQFQGRSAFSTWLHSIIRNSVRMHFRKKQSHMIDSLESENLVVEPTCAETRYVATRPSPEELCIEKERSDILRRAVTMLPNQHHRLVLSFYLQGLGEMETSKKLQIGRNALKSQLHRSRRILSLNLRKFRGAHP